MDENIPFNKLVSFFNDKNKSDKNKSDKNKSDKKSVLWIVKDKMGRNTYEYSLNIGIECINILHCYKMYNIVPNMFYASIW